MYVERDPSHATVLLILKPRINGLDERVNALVMIELLQI